jgi:fructose-1,6-bisphosphatase/inositol monophosphatase family enzyme
VVLVREAGGYVTGLDGGHYNPYTPHILATNRRVHGEALDALKSAWPAQG